jgi:CDP-diacylglycerol--glycerol-3-phosphate 3-phosphatidyltransferase
MAREKGGKPPIQDRILAVGVGSTFWAAGTGGIGWLWGAEVALPWALSVGFVTGWILLELEWAVRGTPPEQRQELDAGLGLANWTTLARGAIAAILAGFLVLPPSSGRVAWLAMGLFLVNALADILDGSLARRLGRETRVGRRMDQTVDVLSMLIGIGLAVRWGRLPVWYLLLGVAPFLFRGFRWVRGWSGLPVPPLPHRPSRRALAALLFGWVTFSLAPVSHPSMVSVATVGVGVALLGSFALDIWASGKGAAREPRATHD